MIVADTNVLVRLVTKDDVEQTKAAVALVSTDEKVWISRVVLLEVGWVLKSKVYGYTRENVSRALRMLVAWDGSVVEDDARVRDALRYHREGMDLGDAFILAFVPAGASVSTFDKRFVKRAAAFGEAAPVRLVPTPPDEK